jgi:NAD(P)-dependent dehydrogenase (short-subunit alcohol dehydrogenase family)
MQDFKNKVAVITGAGSGFGREFARYGAAHGMKLVLADVQMDALEATRAEVAALGVEVITRRADVAQAADVEALAAAAMDAFGVVHLVFNNAGVATGGLIWENSQRDWEWTLGVNLWGVIHGVRIFTPLMLAAAAKDPDYRGHIVNTASMAGLLTPPASGVYNVSKHAVVALSETMFHDLSLVTKQIHCSVLCPYFVPTGIHLSQRNRPDELKNEAPPTASQLVAQAMAEKAVTSGKVTAEAVATMTFDAIRNEAFYIFSHPRALGLVQQRLEDLVAIRPPADPFADRPDVRMRLESALNSTQS